MGARRALIGVAAVAVLAVVGWLVLASGRRPPGPVSRRAAPAAAPAAARSADVLAGADRGEPVPPQANGAPDIDDGGDELGGDAIAAAWANVDLDEVRRALPDNLYWQLAAPTTDEQEIERRARERDRWNVEYGKVLSGTGTEEEIRAYYDERARLSGDYVEFTTYLLDHYGDVLPERDVSLLQLARRLHLARLEEIPRNLEQALQRKAQQDEARARWQAEERAFRGDE